MQIYSFTPILMKFCTLDLQNKKKITVCFNFTKTISTIFNRVKKKRQFFRVGNTLTFTASPLFHPLSISSPSPLDTHKNQPLLSFLSLLSTKKVFSSWKSRLHDMFRCHSYIWLFIKLAISQNVFE
jgi:ABC-type polysaccharide/polyol phosphate export permease